MIEPGLGMMNGRKKQGRKEKKEGRKIYEAKFKATRQVLSWK